MRDLVDDRRLIGAIARRISVVGGSRERDEQSERTRRECGAPRMDRHHDSLTCRRSKAVRHPHQTERARPARQSDDKVLGFGPFE